MTLRGSVNDVLFLLKLPWAMICSKKSNQILETNLESLKGG